MAHNRFFEELIVNPMLNKFHTFYNASTGELKFNRTTNAHAYDGDARDVLAFYLQYQLDLPAVSVLNVDHVWLAREGLSLLERIIKLNLPELKTLSVKACALDNAAINTLQLALLENDSIQHIDISDNACTDDRVNAFKLAMRNKSGTECTVKVKAEKRDTTDRFFSTVQTEKPQKEVVNTMRFSFSE